jgi:hypothetical protein
MRSRRERSAFVRAALCVVALVPACLLAVAHDARADGTDTSYGRLNGDVAVVLGAGAVLGPRAPRGAADLRLRYLQTAGVFVTYEDALGGSADPARVIAVGAELRPLFLGRWLTGRELERKWLDLVLDSIGLELGAAFYQPAEGSFASRPALQAGIGVELPVLGADSGPWIGVHGGARWSETALGAGDVAGPDDAALYLALTLSWHQVLVAHVVDVGDRAPR